jgi:hypothetical protein
MPGRKPSVVNGRRACGVYDVFATWTTWALGRVALRRAAAMRALRVCSTSQGLAPAPVGDALRDRRGGGAAVQAVPVRRRIPPASEPAQRDHAGSVYTRVRAYGDAAGKSGRVRAGIGVDGGVSAARPPDGNGDGAAADTSRRRRARGREPQHQAYAAPQAAGSMTLCVDGGYATSIRERVGLVEALRILEGDGGPIPDALPRSGKR